MFIFISTEQIRDAIEKGIFVELRVRKDIPVRARLGMVGEQLVTLAEGEDGASFVETTNCVKHEGDYVVTNQISGRDNSYIVRAAKFASLYTQDVNDPSLYHPKGEDRTVWRVCENYAIDTHWGSRLNILAGGVLVANGDKFDDINPKEFLATYSILA